MQCCHYIDDTTGQRSGLMINCFTFFNLILFIFNLIHKLFSISNVSKCVFLAKNVTVYHERVPQSYHKLVIELIYTC